MNDPRHATTIVTDFCDLDVEVFEVNDDRALRDEVASVEASLDDYSAEQHEALAVLVSDALERLARSPDAWLPRAFVAKSNTKFGIFILWDNGHLDDAVLRQRVRARHEHDQRLADLQRLAEGLDEPAD